MVQKFSEIDHVTPLFKFFLVIHLQTHSVLLFRDIQIPKKLKLFSFQEQNLAHHHNHQHQESFNMDVDLKYTGIFFALESDDMWKLHYHELYCLFVIFGTKNNLENDICMKDLEAIISTRNDNNEDDIEDFVATNWTSQIDRIPTTSEFLINTAAFFGDVSEINFIVGMNEIDGICTVCLEGGHLLTLLNVSIKNLGNYFKTAFRNIQIIRHI